MVRCPGERATTVAVDPEHEFQTLLVRNPVVMERLWDTLATMQPQAGGRPAVPKSISWTMTGIHETRVAIGNVGEWLNGPSLQYNSERASFAISGTAAVVDAGLSRERHRRTSQAARAFSSPVYVGPRPAEQRIARRR